MSIPLRPFAEVVEDVSGGSPKLPQSGFLPDGSLPVVDQGQRLIAGYTNDPRLQCRVEGPVIVFGDHTRAFKYVDFPFVIGADGVKVLRVRSGWDSKFVYHYLRSRRIPSAGYSRHFKFLKELEVPMPPLEEQRRVATILDQIGSLRTKRRRGIDHLNDLASSIFVEMLHESGAGEWRPFGELCRRVTVGVVVKPASHYVPEGVPALRTLNVKPGNLDLTDLVYFTSQSNDGPLAKSKLCADDLVIARTGRPGTTAIVPPSLAGANAIDLIVVTPDQKQALPIFLESLMNSVLGKRLVAGEQRGQIQQHFNIGSLKRSIIPVPPMKVQHELAARLERVKEEKRRQQEQDRVLTELFEAAQSRLFYRGAADAGECEGE